MRAVLVFISCYCRPSVVPPPHLLVLYWPAGGRPVKRGRGRPPRHTKVPRGSTPSARPAAGAAADGSKSSLFALLAALEKQVGSSVCAGAEHGSRHVQLTSTSLLRLAGA